MKYILLMFGLLLSKQSISQFYIGWSESKVRNYLKSENIGEINKEIGDDGIVIMSWKNYKMKYTEMVFFNKDKGIVKVESLHPDNNEIFNMLVRVYDENFVKQSSTLWKAYLYGTTYKIEAKYSKDIKSYLIYITEWD